MVCTSVLPGFVSVYGRPDASFDRPIEKERSRGFAQAAPFTTGWLVASALFGTRRRNKVGRRPDIGGQRPIQSIQKLQQVVALVERQKVERMVSLSR